ncbi:bifunctional folylpolyglutamate synthase/dihydrofolate synthase [Nanchangia anserum]|uniref:tetrahydrofolate synthase n=1 Tax=Nanchangia anserum TaxID=2692125 RepID=A0A8I0G717_9ACTO|nr:folylpolyglutamate synthase/dihydrofolate synthase family protein [Nanchangia anserum]MBD3689010.1 bifunctional folylpolyglutamate synthase/dihydrofolate synthase [Nanchangia anserum]QOX81256.1 bifunctional folylpolyglutamate synthase/dihydrofolate synthase [Nanchangia anserum]
MASGSDPELAPYLEAADTPDAPDTLPIVEATPEASGERGAVSALVEASLIGGPLGADVVREVSRDERVAKADEDDVFAQAAERAVAEERVNRIFASLMERAPEHRISPTRERIERVLEWMGDPQLAYTTVHVAGTNGKTTTARMIESIVRASGQRTGLFTSPHLHSPRERICLDGAPISAPGFVDAWQDVEAFIDLVDRESRECERGRLSFFECLTAMAFQAFADAPVAVGVIEVGMGGTWDCTNVLDSAVQVITPIARDHEAWLGHTIAEIARNKAGIIRPGGIVISGRQVPEALAVLEEVAAAQGAQLRVLGRDFDVVAHEKAVGGSLISVRTPAALYEDIYVPVLGEYQGDNAACALAAAEVLWSGQPLEAALAERGLASVTSPGRAEIVRTSPMVMVDSAHNPHGAAALRSLIETDFSLTHVVGVFAGMADKNTEGVLAEMEPLLDSLVVTTLDTERALDVEAARAIAIDVFGPDRVIAAATPAEALDLAAAETDASGDPTASVGIVCFGSVILAGDVRALCGRADVDGQVGA